MRNRRAIYFLFKRNCLNYQSGITSNMRIISRSMSSDSDIMGLLKRLASETGARSPAATSLPLVTFTYLKGYIHISQMIARWPPHVTAKPSHRDSGAPYTTSVDTNSNARRKMSGNHGLRTVAPGMVGLFTHSHSGGWWGSSGGWLARVTASVDEFSHHPLAAGAAARAGKSG
jgi:hypothetical protein